MQAGVWIYRVVVALSGITLILVVVYLVVGEQNRTVQAKINERQQFINQSLEFARINQALVRAMATVASNDKDDKLRAVLAQNGITINPKTGAPAAATGTGPNSDLAPAEKRP
jgi:ABC-type cobalamin transport system permease subunit